MAEEGITDLFDKMDSVQNVCSIQDHWRDEPETLKAKLGDMMEDFYQCFENVSEKRGISDQLRHLINSEVSKLANIYRQMNEHAGVTEAQINQFHGPVFKILHALVRAMNAEEFQTSGETVENVACQTGKLLKDFTFPSDMFTTDKVNISEYQVLSLSTFLDGVVSISEEGHLDFLKDVPGTIVWQKNSVACWSPATQFKGVEIELFRRGLPLFRVGQVNNLPLWATFIPNDISPDEDDRCKLDHYKRLYDQVFDTILKEAIGLMPTSSSTRIRNCLIPDENPVKYHLPGHELEQLSANLKNAIDSARLNGNFPAYLTFNFVAMAYGHDTPLTETTVKYIENTLDTGKMRGVAVHLATNINSEGKSLFWTKAFAEKLFKSTGAVYQACGFYDLANGAGKLECQGSVLGNEVAFIKIYNTAFKKLRRMNQDFHQGFSNELLFEQPNIAKVMAYQPFGLPNACRKNSVLRKVVKDLETQLPLKVVNHRLEEMECLDNLHSARVEFVCSLMNTSIRACQQKYTGHCVFSIIQSLSTTRYGEVPTLVALPRADISTYLMGLLSCILTPIRQALVHFFVEKRPVCPDVLETVHVCECLLSFVLYGTKNYFPKLANIGLTMPRYKDVNRITLAYTAMKSRDEVFKIDASANTAGTVYSISLPLIRNRTNEDAFTKELLLIHKQLALNKFNVAEILLTYIMEIIAENVFSLVTPDPLNIFAKPFVQSLPYYRIQQQRITVSDVVEKLLTCNYSDSMTNVIETAIETLGDLEADHAIDDVRTTGTTALRHALIALLNLALKRRILMDFAYFPMLPFTQGYMFRQVVPDLSTIFTDGNPPAFEPKLTQIVLCNAITLLGQLNPYPHGIRNPTPAVMFLLYNLVRSDVHDVHNALGMLGVALVLQKEYYPTTALRHHMRANNITFNAMLNAGLCQRVVRTTYAGIHNDSFRSVFINIVHQEEKEFVRAHNNLRGSGLHKLQMA